MDKKSYYLLQVPETHLLFVMVSVRDLLCVHVTTPTSYNNPQRSISHFHVGASFFFFFLINKCVPAEHLAFDSNPQEQGLSAV